MNKALLNRVNKDLSPEEAAIIADIESSIQQLKQHETAEGPEAGAPAPEDAEVNMAVITDGQPAGSEDQEELEDEKIVGKDGANGSDNADKKIGDLPVDDLEALKVVKAIMALGKGGSVGKSAAAPARSSLELRLLQGIAKSMQAIDARLAQVEEFSVSMVEGMGIADAVVQKSAAAAPARRAVQSNGMDAQAFIEQLAAAVNKSAAQPAEKPGTIRDALSMLTGSNQ